MKVLKSYLIANPQFDLQVAEHAERLRQWRDHMALVEAEKGNDNIAPIDQHRPYDKPRAPDLIEQAIDENFRPAYEIEDDTPAQLPALKAILFNRVIQLEQEAISAIVPPGKQRLFAIRENQIAAADHDRAQLLSERNSRKPGLLQKLLGGENAPFDLKAAIAEQRPREDTKHLEEQQARRARIAAIQEKAAQAMHDIEDLTAETIGAWQDPDFSGV